MIIDYERKSEVHDFDVTALAEVNIHHITCTVFLLYALFIFHVLSVSTNCVSASQMSFNLHKTKQQELILCSLILIR